MVELKIVIKGIVGDINEKDIEEINSYENCVIIKSNTEKDCVAIKNAIRDGEFIIDHNNSIK